MDLEDVQYQIDTERESIQALEDERADLEDTLDDLPEMLAGDLDELETEIDCLRDHKQSLRVDHQPAPAHPPVQLDVLTDRRNALRGDRDRRKRVDHKLNEVDREIIQREATLEKPTDERSTLEDEIDEHEATVEELEGQEQSDLLDRHKEANQLEFELGRIESDLEGVREEIASVEADLAERGSNSSNRKRARNLTITWRPF